MNRKALVVDDNQLIRKLVEGFLKKHGWSVELCEGPFGVINKAKAFQPDLVLLDLNMPGLGGEKLAKMLKTTARTSDIRIMAFSSEDEAIQKKMLDEGIIDGYFIKAHSFDGLDEAMERVMQSPACSYA